MSLESGPASWDMFMRIESALENIRVPCETCGREIRTTARKRVLYRHKNKRGAWCEGSYHYRGKTDI